MTAAPTKLICDNEHAIMEGSFQLRRYAQGDNPSH